MREEWIASGPAAPRPAALLAAWTGYRAWRVQLFLGARREDHRLFRAADAPRHQVRPLGRPAEDGMPFEFQAAVYRRTLGGGPSSECRRAAGRRRPDDRLLLVAQGRHRLDPERPARRRPGRDQGHHDEEAGHGHVGGGIDGAGSEEEAP